MNSTSRLASGIRLAGMLVAVGLAVSACGGSSDDNGGGDAGGGGQSGFISNGAVAASASESSSSFIAAVRQVVALGADETSEPLSLQGVNAPPEDNTSEPVAL